ncbi:MAG: glycosyltransferase family 39 protein [Candidatus Gottesmanbacteria bacterium]
MPRYIRNNLFLILILVLSFCLRFWQLGSIPSGIHADEAVTGYTAYSLGKIGVDLGGTFNLFGITDVNIGGTAPPIYTFILVPLVKIFGLSIGIIRLPSAIFGVLSVILVYLISKNLFKSQQLSLLITFLFAVNPWAIHISRQGMLESISLLFVLAGIFFFLYSDNKKYLFIISALFLGLSFFVYDAPKIFLPLFVLALFFYKKDMIFRNKKYFLIFIIVFSIFLLVLFQQTFLVGEYKEFTKSSIININKIAEMVDVERNLSLAPLWLTKIFHNKLTVGFKTFLNSYSTVFSLNWFFFNGSNNLQQSVGRHGQFYFFELPFFFYGLYLLFKTNKKLFLFLLSWIFIGALPGGLTSGNYAYRSVHILPAPIFFSGLGLYSFWHMLKKSSVVKQLILKLILIIICFSFITSYFLTYYFDYPVYASEWWAKQQNQALEYAQSREHSYQKIFIDGEGSWVVMYAFQNKIDPSMYRQAYQNQVLVNNTKTIQLGKFYFGQLIPSEESDTFKCSYVKNCTPSIYFPKNSLVITNALNFPKEKYVKAFYDPGAVRIIFKAFAVK